VKNKLLYRRGSLLGLLLFAEALWVLHHELKDYSLHETSCRPSTTSPIEGFIISFPSA
jgi:hypothetical protein